MRKCAPADVPGIQEFGAPRGGAACRRAKHCFGEDRPTMTSSAFVRDESLGRREALAHRIGGGVVGLMGFGLV